MTRVRTLVWLGLIALSPPAFAQTRGRALPRWQLSATPVLRIGEEGDPNYEFQRVVGVVRTTSGEIIVGNSGSQELRVFSPSGSFVRSISRRGQGPGELQNLGMIIRNRDSVFALEGFPGPSQLHTFTLTGGFRTKAMLRAANAPRGVTVLGRLSTGGLLVRSGGFLVVTPPPLGTLRRDSATFGVLRVGDPGEVTWLGAFPDNTWFSYSLSSGPVQTTMSRYLLGPSSVAIAVGEKVWIGDTGSGVIQIFNATGELAATTTAPFASRAFSPPALDRAKSRALESATTANVRSRIEALYSSDIRPPTTPRFSRMMAGAPGEVWIEAFAEDASAATEVTVVSETGRHIATLTIPPNVVIHEAGSDYAVGVETDADGIQRVVHYQLRRQV